MNDASNILYLNFKIYAVVLGLLEFESRRARYKNTSTIGELRSISLYFVDCGRRADFYLSTDGQEDF